MNGNIEKMIIGGYDCLLYLPENYEEEKDYYPVVYINGEGELDKIMESIEKHFDVDCKKFICISILSQNWNKDYSPWAAPKLSDGNENFAGKAIDYIKILVNTIKKYVEQNYRVRPESQNKALVGYSLAGLATLYTGHVSKEFGKLGSISGSLWFDGWEDFLQRHELINSESKIYVSLGKKEEFSKNKRMAKVSQCTKQTIEIFSEQLDNSDDLLFEWNEGGHFTNVSERMVKGILWLMKI